MAIKYMVNDGNSISEFKTWGECEKFIEGKYCKYKKCKNKEEENKFIEESNLFFKSNKSKKKIYVAIYENKAYQFNNWHECEKFVSDKKNITYKGFTSQEDAQIYIKNNIKQKIDIDMDDVMYAFVDGSYDKYTGTYGYGICIRKNKETIYEDFGGSKDEKSSMHQVYGELIATLKAIEYAIEHKEMRIIIVYDYTGIELWANGSWKAKNEHVEEYIRKIKEYENVISIDFLHVNSHVKKDRIKELHNFNDRADELAKKGILLKNF